MDFSITSSNTMQLLPRALSDSLGSSGFLYVWRGLLLFPPALDLFEGFAGGFRD